MKNWNRICEHRMATKITRGVLGGGGLVLALPLGGENSTNFSVKKILRFEHF